jgi:hypothetical protein
MKLPRKGSSIFMVLAVMGVFFTMIMGLLRQSSSEMRLAKQQIGHQSAELIALSGIDYAEGRLRKNRWYQPPFSKDGSKGRPTYTIEYPSPPGGEGKLTIACQDVAKKTPVSNIWGMQQLWLLHHIDVFSLGEYAGKKCLIYGRFIVSPEPALNSDSTDGLIYSDANYNPYEVNVRIPEPASADPNASFIIKKYKVFSGQKVDLNTVVAELDAADGSQTGIPVFASSHGKVAARTMNNGDSCKPGDVFLTLKKTPTSGGPGSLKTLKKMVRISKIDMELFPDFDISNLSDRVAVAEYVNQTSNAYLLNFVSHQSLEDAIANLQSSDLPEKLSTKDLLEMFPPDISNMTRERAENIFLTYLLKTFVPPGANWEKKDQANKEAYLQLDHVKTNPPADMVDFLSKNGIKWTLNSKPRINDRYYNPRMYKDEFLRLLSPKFNLPVDQFVEQISWLPDATRSFDVQVKEEGFNESSTVKEDERSIYIVKEDGDPHPIKVQIQKIKKAYSYVDPVNDFAIQMVDLVEFFKKYYSASEADIPKEEKRQMANIDWPLPDEPGPPPAAPQGYMPVWKPGIPGTPPGLPTWEYIGGKKVEIPYPTGSSRTFEPSGGHPDGGRKDYPISKTDTATTGDGDFSEGKNPNKPEAPFSTLHPPIEFERDGNWSGTPGTDGIPPTQGKWDFVKIPDPPSQDADATPHECKSCCFAPGTIITMADGSEKNIEDVKIGDMVTTYDEATDRFSTGTVIELESPVRDHLTTVTFVDGSEVKLTNEHPLFTRKGWAAIDPEMTFEGHHKRVKTLRVGDEVRHQEQEWLKIESIFTEAQSIKVYNLSGVEPHSTFIAERLVAHNKKCTECGKEMPGGDAGGGASSNTATGEPGSDGTDAGGNAQSGGGPGGGSGGNDSNTGNMPGGGSAAGGGTGNTSDNNQSGSSSSPGNSSPGGGSGTSTSNTGGNNPGGTSSSSRPGGSSGAGGSNYPSSRPSGGSSGGSRPSYSRSSSFSI